MGIAVIGWGSLIWCPGSLRTRSSWHADGPLLPIEFARISSDGRLTLVIHAGSPKQKTYWAISHFDQRNAAIENLAQREGTCDSSIAYLNATGECSRGLDEIVRARMAEWLVAQPQLSCAVWTNLPTNWRKKRNRDFSVEDAMVYLSELESRRDEAVATLKRAREYIQNTPPQIQTEVRRRARDEKDWIQAQLASSLFEQSETTQGPNEVNDTARPEGA